MGLRPQFLEIEIMAISSADAQKIFQAIAEANHHPDPFGWADAAVEALKNPKTKDAAPVPDEPADAGQGA